MPMKDHFSSRPPANRIKQIEFDRAGARLNGTAILVVLALSVMLVGLVIFLEAITTAPVF